MKIPLEIAFKGIEHTDEIEALIREEADKLERVCNYLMSCRVAVEKRQQHQEVGQSVPGPHRHDRPSRPRTGRQAGAQ